MTALVVAACLAGLVIYQSYFRSDGVEGEVLTTDAANSLGGAELLNSLSELRSVKLDSSIFSDPEFLSLVDFGRTIAPEPVGRSNPFAPLGAVESQGGSAGVAPGAVR